MMLKKIMEQRLSGWLCLLILTSVVCVGCYKQQEDRWAAADKESKENPEATVALSEHGSAFNRFFPQVESPYDIIYKQEKDGFAQANLLKNGKELATLSVSDTVNNKEAAAKYADSTTMISGYPSVSIGEKATGLLVKDRFQVQIRSIDESFTATEREAWLEKFDLEGIKTLE